MAYTNFDDILNSPHRDLIDINLVRGVSPYTICKELKKIYRCKCNSPKVMAYRKKYFPGVETVKNTKFIRQLNDFDNDDLENEEKYTTEALANLRLKIGIKTGNRINERLDNGEDLDARETQLFSTCCKSLDKDLVNDTPEIEYTEDDVEWIDNVSSYT